MPFTISLSADTEDAVRRHAAKAGVAADCYVAELVEQAVKRPSLRELLAPIHQEVAVSGIRPEELDRLIESAIDHVRE